MAQRKAHPEREPADRDPTPQGADAGRVADVVAAMDGFVALGLIGQHAVAERLGVNVTDLTCLGHILGAGGTPIGAGELAERAGLTTGAVTGVLNRLERAGYARRSPDPADRRRVRITADPAAAARLGEAYGPFYAGLHAMIGGHDPAQLDVLEDFFTRAAALMRTSLACMPDPGGPGA